MGRIIAPVAYVVVLAFIGDAVFADSPSTNPSPGGPASAPTYYPDAPPGVYSRPNPARPDQAPPRRVYWRPDAEPLTPAPPPPAPAQFAAGHFDFNLSGQGYTAHGAHGSDTIGFVTFDMGYFIVDGLSIGFEAGLSPGTFDDRHHHDDFSDDHHHRDDGLRAAEALAMVRWHFLTCGPVSLYADAGLGGLYADHHFPNGGRSGNALGVAGLGLSVRLVDHLYIAGGGRYARLGFDDWHDHSDFDHHRHGSDGAQYYLGVSFIP